MGAFSIFASKKKRSSKAAERETRTPGQFYETLARRVGYTKYAVLFLLILFVLFGFTFFSDHLTIENFRYMLKFMSIDVDTEIAEGDSFVLDTGENVRSVIVGGDLAVVDTNGVQVFDMTGTRFLKDTRYLDEPLVASNGTNLFVCEYGGLTLDIYSVYMNVSTETFPYPIYGLAASKTGNYSVNTASAGYRSAIKTYDSNFRIIHDYHFADRYIVAIGISDDGTKSAACTLTNNESGEFLGGLYVWDVTEADPIYVYDFVGEIPWRIDYRSDGSFVLLTNKALRVYGEDGERKNEVSLRSLDLKGYAISDGLIVVSSRAAGLSDATTLYFYSADGELKGTYDCPNDVSDINIAGKYAYIYSVGSLCVIDTEKAEEVSREDLGSDYITSVYDPANDRFILLRKGKTVFYDVKKDNDNGGNKK